MQSQIFKIHGWLENCTLKIWRAPYLPYCGWVMTIYDVDGSIYKEENGMGSAENAVARFESEYDGCWLEPVDKSANRYMLFW